MYTIRYGERMRFFQKGLQRRGSFTVFTTKNWQDNRIAYFFESPIDALSFYQMYKEEGVYLSTCGSLTHAFLKDILEVLKVFKTKRVILAFDNDEAGERMYQALTKRLKPIYPVCIQKSKGKDWNEDILNAFTTC